MAERRTQTWRNVRNDLERMHPRHARDQRRARRSAQSDDASPAGVSSRPSRSPSRLASTTSRCLSPSRSSRSQHRVVTRPPRWLASLFPGQGRFPGPTAAYHLRESGQTEGIALAGGSALLHTTVVVRRGHRASATTVTGFGGHGAGIGTGAMELPGPMSAHPFWTGWCAKRWVRKTCAWSRKGGPVCWWSSPS